MDIKKDSYHHYVNDKTIDQWNCVCVCVCVCVLCVVCRELLLALLTSLVAQMVKHLPTVGETQVGFLGWEIPWRRKWHPTPVLLPGKFHGLRSLVGYSPWARKESDTTERLHFHYANYTCTYKHVFL